MGPLPRSEDGRIGQYVRNGKERNEGKLPRYVNMFPSFVVKRNVNKTIEGEVECKKG